MLDRLEHVLKHYLVGQQNIAVVVLDCARFETITDTLGHLRGDQLLIQIANRLSATVSTNSLVARLRGDEFAILFNAPSDLEGFVDAVQAALSAPMELGEYEIVISPSIGIAVSSDEDQKAEHLLRDAYQAMAQAQTTGNRQLATV